MSRLLTPQKRDPYQILCVACRSFLYFYSGTFTGKFDWTEFKPSHPGVPQPGPGVDMKCSCGKPFYMVNTRGGLIFMTNQGWKPREPDGPSRVIVPGQDRITVNKPDETEYEEPRS